MSKNGWSAIKPNKIKWNVKNEASPLDAIPRDIQETPLTFLQRIQSVYTKIYIKIIYFCCIVIFVPQARLGIPTSSLWIPDT